MRRHLRREWGDLSDELLEAALESHAFDGRSVGSELGEHLEESCGQTRGSGTAQDISAKDDGASVTAHDFGTDVPDNGRGG